MGRFAWVSWLLIRPEYQSPATLSGGAKIVGLVPTDAFPRATSVFVRCGQLASLRFALLSAMLLRWVRTVEKVLSWLLVAFPFPGLHPRTKGDRLESALIFLTMSWTFMRLAAAMAYGSEGIRLGRYRLSCQRTLYV